MNKWVLIVSLTLVLMMDICLAENYNVNLRIPAYDAYYAGTGNTTAACRYQFRLAKSGGTSAMPDPIEVRWDNITCPDTNRCRYESTPYEFTIDEVDYRVRLEADNMYYHNANQQCHFDARLINDAGVQLVNIEDRVAVIGNSNSADSWAAYEINLEDAKIAGTQIAKINVTCSVPATTVTCPAIDLAQIPACPACTCNGATCPACNCPVADLTQLTTKPLNIKLDLVQILLILGGVAVIIFALSQLKNSGGGNNRQSGGQQRPPYNQFPGAR